MFACAVFQALANSTRNRAAKEAFERAKSDFESLAISFLDYLKKVTDPKDCPVHILLQRPVPVLSNLNCLNLAKEARLMKVFNHPTCKTLMDHIWFGQISSRGIDQYPIISVLAALCPPLIFFQILRGSFREEAKIKQKSWYLSIEVHVPLGINTFETFSNIMSLSMYRSGLRPYTI